MTPFSLAPETVGSGLARFGYGAEEAAFLRLVALQSGYFLRRQAAQFFGSKDGRRVTPLVDKAVALEHARSSTWRRNTQLYHLSSRPFYEALGESNNRNRRRHELTQIKNRVMALDYVLDRSTERF